MDIFDFVKKTISDYYLITYKINHDEKLLIGNYAKFGDISTSSPLALSKKTNKNPIQVADELCEYIKSLKNKYIQKVESVNPGFVNIYLNNEYWSDTALEIFKNIDYFGSNKSGRNKKWIVEHTSPNSNKCLHIGHLRNNIFAMALCNLVQNSGYELVRDCIYNNRGIAMAKMMWGYLKYARKDNKEITDIQYWVNHKSEWNLPEDLNVRPDRFVDDLYVKGNSDYEKDENIKGVIKKYVIEWENEDKNIWELWKFLVDYAFTGQLMTLKRLGSKWDNIWYEHEIYKMGKEIIFEGMKNNVFRKSEGAIVTNLAKYNLPDTIAIKSDGTANYLTQDISLTKLKIEKFKADKYIWVVGPEQTLQFQQLFAICEMLEWGLRDKFLHLFYGFVTIKGMGKMSSRKGNVLYIDDLLDKCRDTILPKIKNQELTSKDKLETAEKLGLASVKYSLLSVSRNTPTIFDFETSLSFEGNSGPYIMYTYTRALSVLEKYTEDYSKVNKLLFDNDIEMNIIKKISEFPNICQKAVEEYSPNLVCNFMFELSQLFNHFYNELEILKSGDKEKTQYRVILTYLVSRILKKSFEVLNIDTVDKM